jgi:AraC-like DNA-binding protein
MHYELSFKMIEHDYKAFLQDGFYASPKTDTSLHKHNYAEIHVLGEGRAEFLIENRSVTVVGPAILTIPAPMMHCCTYQDEHLLHTAFQTDCQADQLRTFPLEMGLVKSFTEEIQRCRFTGNYSTVALYIPLFCSYYHRESLAVTEIKDYNFLISEFFILNYDKDVYLADLAEQLHISERHAERLVLQYTGHSFREELVAVRMRVADQLMQRENASLEQIAKYVGYRSYSGFWKAMKRHEGEKTK